MFLICTLLLREYERHGKISLKGFYIRRAFRILPPALLYLATAAILAALGVIAVNRNELTTALLAANYFPDRLWFTAHFWSLSVEEHFYLVWPALLVWLGPRKACWTGLFLAALCIVYRPWAAEHIEGAFRYQRTDMRIDAFVLPCALAILLRKEVWQQRAARWLNEGAVLGLLLLLAAVSLAAEEGSLNTLNKFLQAGLLPLIVISPIFRPSSMLASALMWAPLRWLGKVSYGVYLWQQMFLEDTSSTAIRLLLLPVAVATIFLCAWASSRFLEKPLRDYGRRLAATA